MTAKSYLHLCDESEWGTLPNSPTYYHVPVIEYNVEQNVEARTSQVYAGTDHEIDSEILRGNPQGQLSSYLYGWWATGAGQSLAQKLLEWGFADVTSVTPRSKVAEWADGLNLWNRRDLGLRCNQAELSGSQDNADIRIALDLIGREQIGQGDEDHVANFSSTDPLPTAQTAPNDLKKLASFLFHHATFAISPRNDLSGSKTAMLMRDFKLQYNRGLKPHWLNARSATTDKPVLGSLNSRPKTGMFSVTPLKASSDWDALRRTPGRHEFAATLTLKGLHQGTGSSGTWTQVAIALNRLSLVKPDSDEKRDDEAFQPLEFKCLKPESTSQWITMTWSEV